MNSGRFQGGIDGIDVLYLCFGVVLLATIGTYYGEIRFVMLSSMYSGG
jgi:hypothetical protein